MSKKYAKRTRRSRRKPAKDLEGHVRDLDIGEGTATVQLSLPISEILAGARGAPEAVAGEAGLLIMESSIDAYRCCRSVWAVSLTLRKRSVSVRAGSLPDINEGRDNLRQRACIE